MEKKKPGRPKINDLSKSWTSIQFRLPIEVRHQLNELLQKKNENLPYHLSLNSFLLELMKNGMKLS